MRLLSARFDGFRLLTGVEIEFSTDRDRNITVIRAANESGKTTMLTALQWALIGDEVLPKGYSLRPIGIPPGTEAETRVEIDYEVDAKTGSKHYRLVRRLTTTSKDASAPKSIVDLYEVTRSGDDPLSSPYNHIRQHFPAELREVFFTDGDRALSFIEGAAAEQQHKVRNAIERMMGLSLLEATIDHVKRVESQLRSRFEREAGNAETRHVQEEIEAIDRRLPILEQKLENTRDKIANLAQAYATADKDLQDALSLGNRDELSKELVSVRSQRAKLDDQRRATEKRQSELLSSEVLARHLLAQPLQKAGQILEKLRKVDHFPKKVVPILEDCLEQNDCICGETLKASDPDGQRRRDHIEKLIADSRDADAVREKISDLYVQGRPLFTGKPRSWSDLYSEAFEERQRIDSVYAEVGERAAELEAKLDKIPDVNIQRLRDFRSNYESQLVEERRRGHETETDIKRAKEEKVALENKFRTLSAKVEKGQKIARELDVAQDIRTVVEVALERMKTVEVKSVSARMNELFMDMIGADEENSLIKRAEIGEDFRIVVYNRDDEKMNPSVDLNGASRRALTISFVLALTQISGVDAPNVIDTPLGMMSGFVKTEVVRTAAENCSQLILFLTHDEIKGCEDILDKRAVVAGTLTNPAHYPRILKNDPGTKDAVALLCSCDHRSSCKICDRYESKAQAELEGA